MFDIALVPFLIFAFSAVGTPGPANMLMMATGARFGLWRAVPFMAGVVLSKQFVIWPIGLGLMSVLSPTSPVFIALKWASAAYMLWLAWRVAQMRMDTSVQVERAPSLAAGLVVHPLNPKAWAMLITIFTNFVPADAPILPTTATVATLLLVVQCICAPIWAGGGVLIARLIAGTAAERYVMAALAVLTAATVLFVLFGGGH